jgi:uncharacterized membrane protein
MRRTIESIVEMIQFAGVAVAFAGVVVAVVRTGVASLAGDRGERVMTIRFDLARTVLLGIDLILASAILAAAVDPRKPNFQRLGTVAAIWVVLSVLVAFEESFRAASGDGRPATARSRTAPALEAAVRRHFRPAGAHPPEPRPWPKTRARPRHAGGGAAPTDDQPPVENLWPARARLGRD